MCRDTSIRGRNWAKRFFFFFSTNEPVRRCESPTGDFQLFDDGNDDDILKEHGAALKEKKTVNYYNGNIIITGTFEFKPSIKKFTILFLMYQEIKFRLFFFFKCYLFLMNNIVYVNWICVFLSPPGSSIILSVNLCESNKDRFKLTLFCKNY